MKSKKILIIILAIILVIAVVIGLVYMNSINKEYVIPEGYTKTLQFNMSHVDGPDITYYVYEDKVIAESILVVPVGAPYPGNHIITEYNNISTKNVTTVEDVRELIKDVEGKEVYREDKPM